MVGHSYSQAGDINTFFCLLTTLWIDAEKKRVQTTQN